MRTSDPVIRVLAWEEDQNGDLIPPPDVLEGKGVLIDMEELWYPDEE